MNNKGITLISLVITIVVLIILAGVSIAMLTGENGIITKANKADLASEKASVIEQVNLELAAQYANALAGDKFDTDIQTRLDAQLGEGVVTVTAGNVESKTELKITVNKTELGLTENEGKVAYNTSKWEMTAVK